MNLLQNSVYPEHHVIECAFHHHDAGLKRKMLGGVSFDGGGSAGQERHTASQAGERTGQPSFSDINLTGVGNGIDVHGIVGRGRVGNVIKGKAAGHQKDSVKISAIQNQKKTDAAAETLAIIQSAAVEITDTDKIADVIENKQLTRKLVLDYKKYMGKIRNGIQTFMKGMEQKAGKENRQQPKKKKMTGTRAVTKEEVYEIKVNTAYLLDSYNKYGERSTLGQ